jgi:hypothetical protein
MMKRYLDPVQINKIINQPSIHGKGKLLDCKILVENLRNFFIMSEYGGFYFNWSAPDIFEGHTFILPHGRGKIALQMAKETFDYMFNQGAKMIWGQTPVSNLAARKFNRLIGMESKGIEKAHIVPGRNPEEVEVFTMEFPRWELKRQS